MKKIIVALCFMASFKAQSQTVDTTIKGGVAAKITPIFYSHDIPIITDTLTHIIVFDNKFSYVDNVWTIPYAIRTPLQNIIIADFKSTKEQYDSWDGSAVGLLAIIGNYLKVKFK